MSSQPFFAVKATFTWIICHSDQVSFLLLDSQDKIFLTNGCHPFLEWGNNHVTFSFAYKNSQYNHCGRMWLCSPLIAEKVCLKIVNTPLTLNLMIYQQSLDNHQLYAKVYIVVMGSPYSVSMCTHLHPKALRPLNFWSTPRYSIWAIKDIGLSHFSAFGQQLTAYKSILYILI